ncbi:MAG: CGNR zinc finger domain-containing protein [Actinomycetota bacterium]
MERRVIQRAPADGGPAIDLAGTVLARGAGDPEERVADLLSGPADLARWLEHQEPWLGPAPEEASLRLADFRGLRGAIRSLLAASVAGEAMPPAAVRAVNDASAAMPGHLALDATDPRAPVAVVAGSAGSATAEILARIARSAIEIVGGPDRERIRVCPAPRCRRYFRASRAGQVWCGDACGNRVRVARYHERRRAPRPPGARA